MQADIPLGLVRCTEEVWDINVRALGLSDRVVGLRLPVRTVLASVLFLGIYELALDPALLASWNLLRDSVDLRAGGAGLSQSLASAGLCDGVLLDIAAAGGGAQCRPIWAGSGVGFALEGS